MVHQLGLADAKGVATPGIKEDSELSAAEILERDPSASSFQLQKEVHWSVSVDAYSRFCIGDTPLIVAAKRGNTEVLQLLIENGALLEMRDSGCHSTAIAWAADETSYPGHPSCARLQSICANLE